MNKEHPSNLEDHIGYWLRCLSNYVSYSFTERLTKHDVSVAQWVVLRSLYDKDEISQNEAAQLLGVDKSSLSRMVERLIGKQLIVRKLSSEDQRAYALKLSPLGKRLVPMLANEADENDGHFFKSLSAKDRVRFLQIIKQLLHANGWNATGRGQDRMN